MPCRFYSVECGKAETVQNCSLFVFGSLSILLRSCFLKHWQRILFCFYDVFLKTIITIWFVGRNHEHWNLEFYIMLRTNYMWKAVVICLRICFSSIRVCFLFSGPQKEWIIFDNLMVWKMLFLWVWNYCMSFICSIFCGNLQSIITSFRNQKSQLR